VVESPGSASGCSPRTHWPTAVVLQLPLDGEAGLKLHVVYGRKFSDPVPYATSNVPLLLARPLHLAAHSKPHVQGRARQSEGGATSATARESRCSIQPGLPLPYQLTRAVGVAQLVPTDRQVPAWRNAAARVWFPPGGTIKLPRAVVHIAAAQQGLLQPLAHQARAFCGVLTGGGPRHTAAAGSTFGGVDACWGCGMAQHTTCAHPATHAIDSPPSAMGLHVPRLFCHQTPLGQSTRGVPMKPARLERHQPCHR
jgi:hypothetical protein